MSTDLFLRPRNRRPQRQHQRFIIIGALAYSSEKSGILSALRWPGRDRSESADDSTKANSGLKNGRVRLVGQVASKPGGSSRRSSPPEPGSADRSPGWQPGPEPDPGSGNLFRWHTRRAAKSSPCPSCHLRQRATTAPSPSCPTISCSGVATRQVSVVGKRRGMAHHAPPPAAPGPCGRFGRFPKSASTHSQHSAGWLLSRLVRSQSTDAWTAACAPSSACTR